LPARGVSHRKFELLRQLIAMDEKLRPLTLGEILDRTTRLYRHNFWTFAGVAAVPVVATFAVFVPIGAAMGLTSVFKAGRALPNTEIVELVLLALAIALPVLLVAGVVSQVSLTKTAIGAQKGQKIKVREAIKSVWPRFWRYLWLVALLVLLVVVVPAVVTVATLAGYGASLSATRGAAPIFLGFLAFVVVAAIVVYCIWRWLCYCLAMSACIVEEKTAWQSIKRANSLSKGTRGRIFVMYLLMAALAFVIAMIADVLMFIGIAIATAIGGSKFGPVAAVAGLIVGLVARLTLQVLIQPVPVIALVLFYYDQRVRTEGYDIELMMEQAGLTSLPVSTAEPAPMAEPSVTHVPESPLTPPSEPGPSPDTVKEQ
jgi:hypothetical protein